MADMGHIHIDVRNLAPVRELVRRVQVVIDEAEGRFVGADLELAIEEMKAQLDAMAEAST